MNSTSGSLLERVCKGGDQDAWQRFVLLYSPFIFDWGRRCGLQPADAADLTQDVFTTLWQKLPEFAYDKHKKFRAWLRTVTLNHWRDRRRRIATRPLPGNDDSVADLETVDGFAALEETEFQQHLVSRALQIMQADFEPTTWEAFWRHGVLRQPAAQVAADLNTSVVAVYSAKSRVLNRLRQELQGLLD